MKAPKLFKRGKILALYRHLTIEKINGEKNNHSLPPVSVDQFEDTNILIWLNNFKQEESKIFALISSNLKRGWKVERIPEFEKAIIAAVLHCAYEIDQADKKNLLLIINQAVDFSKKYLDPERCSYINGILRNIILNQMIKKEENQIA